MGEVVVGLASIGDVVPKGHLGPLHVVVDQASGRWRFRRVDAPNLCTGKEKIISVA